MPTPSTSLSTLRPELASSLMEFDLAMSRRGFIALQVAPVIEVAKPSGSFGKIPIKQLLQNHTTVRAPGGGYNRGRFTFSTASFATVEHGWEEPVDDREATNYAEYIDAEMVATDRAQDFVLRNHEKRVEALVFNTSTWTGSDLTTAVSDAWSSAANATPRADVKAAKQKVREGSGQEANALVCDIKVFENLLDCDEIIDRLKYAGFTDPRPGTITRQALAQALAIDNILVAGMGGVSLQNTANQGQTASLSAIWNTSYAMVCRIAETDDPREPCIARTFHYGEDGSVIGGLVESYREEQTRSNIIRVRHETDELVMYTEAGHLLTNIT